MGNIWITSDTHWGHSNIVKGVSKWTDTWGCRNFNTLEEHNQAIVKGIHSVVKDGDTLYHLGDWSFGGIQNIWNFRKQLPNCEIHLILGNHDDHIRNNRQIKLEGQDRETFTYLTGLACNSFNSGIVNLQDLFISVQEVKTVKHGQHEFFFSHYSHRTWLGFNKGSIHCFGHSHNTLTEDWGKSLDAGVDSAKEILKEYRPFSIEEVIGLMSKREVKFIDGHNKDTNIR